MAARAGAGARRAAPGASAATLRAGDLLEELRRASLDRHASIPKALAATATAVGAGRPAITDPSGDTLTLGRLFLGADAFARVLARAGLAPGERVGVLLPTVAGVPVVLTALWRLEPGAGDAEPDARAGADALLPRDGRGAPRASRAG